MHPGVDFRAPHRGGGVDGVDIDGGVGDGCFGEQRDSEIALGVSDEVLHDAFRLWVVRVAEVRCEPVMSSEPDVVRGGDDDVRDDPAFEACHAVGEDLARDTTDSGKCFGDQCHCGGCFLVRGERSKPPPRVGHDGAEQVQTADSGPVDDQIVTRCPYCGPSAAVMVGAPPFLLLGDQAAEVAVRSCVAGLAGDRQDSFRGDSALRFVDPFGYQVGDGGVVSFTLGPRRWCVAGLVGFEFVDGAFDGLVGGADEFGGSSIRPDFAVSGNDVHAFLRRLQWNSPGGAVCGWHLHRHRSGQKFLIDTTNTGWGLSVGHQWGPRPGHQWVLFHGHGHRLDESTCNESPRRVIL
ncbi:hypothetical protein RhoFasSB10_03948 [Rhodococcus fascians]|nr:hypothetical protein [Rhodococcus fascians]